MPCPFLAVECNNSVLFRCRKIIHAFFPLVKTPISLNYISARTLLKIKFNRRSVFFFLLCVHANFYRFRRQNCRTSLCRHSKVIQIAIGFHCGICQLIGWSSYSNKAGMTSGAIGAVSNLHRSKLITASASIVHPFNSSFLTLFSFWTCTGWIYYGKTVDPWIVRLFWWLWYLPCNLLLSLLHCWQERRGGRRQLLALWTGHFCSASKHLLHGADPFQDPRTERHRWHVSEWRPGNLLLSTLHAGAIRARSARRSWSHVDRSFLSGLRDRKVGHKGILNHLSQMSDFFLMASSSRYFLFKDSFSIWYSNVLRTFNFFLAVTHMTLVIFGSFTDSDHSMVFKTTEASLNKALYSFKERAMHYLLYW